VDVASGRVAVAVARERMRPGDLVEVRTPNAVAGIRGTVIVAEVFDPRHSVITVLKGVIDVTRLDAGRLVGPSTILNALQQVTIGGAVSSPQPVSSDTARSMRDEFRTVPPRGAPVATTAAVSQGEMERVSKDLGLDKSKNVQPVSASGGDTTSGSAASTSNAPASAASGSDSTQATNTSAASSGSAPATSNAAPSTSTAATSNAAPSTSAPATPGAAPSAAPVASAPSAAPVTSVPATASPAPVVAPVASAPAASTVAVGGPTVVSPVSAPAASVVTSGGSCACVTAIPIPGAAVLKDLGDLGNSLGSLKDLKADKPDKDTGKLKKH